MLTKLLVKSLQFLYVILCNANFLNEIHSENHNNDEENPLNTNETKLESSFHLESEEMTVLILFRGQV